MVALKTAAAAAADQSLSQLTDVTIRAWSTFSSTIRSNTNTLFVLLFVPNRLRVEYLVTALIFDGAVVSS